MFIFIQSCMLFLVGLLLWGKPAMPPLSLSCQQLIVGMTEQQVLAILGEPKTFSEDYTSRVMFTSSDSKVFVPDLTIHEYTPMFRNSNNTAWKSHRGLPSYSFTIPPANGESSSLNKELVWMDEHHALLLFFDLDGKLGRIEMSPLTIRPAEFADSVRWVWYRAMRLVGKE